MKAEKSQDLQSPGQRPWRVQAQVKTWRAEDKFHSKSEDKRKPISQLESNRAEWQGHGGGRGGLCRSGAAAGQHPLRRR